MPCVVRASDTYGSAGHTAAEVHDPAFCGWFSGQCPSRKQPGGSSDLPPESDVGSSTIAPRLYTCGSNLPSKALYMCASAHYSIARQNLMHSGMTACNRPT